MALSDDVQSRITEQVLIEATNPDDSSATSILTTKLDQAASSVQTRFETYAQEPYDSTVGIHVEVCVLGVVNLLDLWGSGDPMGSSEFWDKFRIECERVRDTRARARIVPGTNSAVTPSQENPTGGELRPWADDRAFDGLHPRNNRAGRDPRID